MRITNNKAHITRTKGVTLIELVIFITVVAIAATGVMAVYINVSRTSADPMVKIRGMELGQALLEEILLKAYDHNTPLGGGCVRFPVGSSLCASGPVAAAQTAATLQADGETRATFNDVDDYHDLAYCGNNTVAADAACASACQPLTDDAGNNIAADYAGYTVCIRVAFSGNELNTVNPGTGLNVSSNDAKRIDVIVTDHLNSRLQLSAYRLNF